jgi:hypothetical protein
MTTETAKTAHAVPYPVVEALSIKAPATVQHPPNPPEACSELAVSANILDRLIADLATAGLYGEDRAAKLLYLALTSRILPRPVSIAMKGPSSAGKSYTVDSVLRFFPEPAYRTLTGMSSKALAYSNEQMVHRFLVIFEAAGMTGGTAAYLMRSLLSEGCLKWETTVKDGNGGFQTRIVKRNGPTGLITTTTRLGLHAENETRMLSVPVNDSAEQTRAVMEAIAEAHENDVDYKPWHALQDWLQQSGGNVTIPFAEKLAKLVNPVATRLRRDFSTLLNLIRAHALLHRATRECDPSGAVIATLDDYAAVRSLIGDLISEGVAASVPPTVRETVQAVDRLLLEYPEGVSLTALCLALELDKSTVSRRVDAAKKDHYLLDAEERPGRPAKLIRGEALPDDVEILPQPEALM